MADRDLDIFDPDASIGRGGQGSMQLQDMVVNPRAANGAGGIDRPQVHGDLMPGSFMSDDDCFDLFIDFIESDEWLLPIESFIDYFCLLFPTPNYNEERPEKMKIF